MMYGLGAVATSGAAGSVATTPPTFSQGLNIWKSPSNGLTAAEALFANTSAAFSSSFLPFTAGVLLPPVAVIGLLLYVMSRGGRR